MQASPPGLSSSLGAPHPPAVPLPHLSQFYPSLVCFAPSQFTCRPHPVRVGCTASLPCWHCPQNAQTHGKVSGTRRVPHSVADPSELQGCSCALCHHPKGQHWDGQCAQSSAFPSPCQHPARSGKRSGSTRAPPDVSSWEQGPGTAESWQQGYESCCKDASRRE